MNVLSTDRVRFGSFEFDRANRLLYRDGAELSLPPRAVGVLSCLIERPGQIVAKQALLDDVWKDANVTETSLTEAVSLLRQVLADDPQRPTFIQTVPRRGYRFVAALGSPAAPATSVPMASAPAGLAPLGAASPDAVPLGAGSLKAGPPGTTASGAPVATAAGATAVGGASAEAAWTSRAHQFSPAVARQVTADGIGSPVDVDVGVPLEPSPSSALGAEPAWPAWLPWLFVVVTLGVLGGIVLAVVRQPSTYARPVVRLSIDLPSGLTFGADGGPAVALSRDGRRAAFVAHRVDGPPRVYVREMDRLDPTVLDGTDGAAAPFFSPDGRWVGFFADGRLKKVPVGGGRVTTLCEARAAFGASWSTRGTIVFASSLTGGLSRVPEDGGAPVTLTTPDARTGEVRHAWPELLPDDSGVIFTGVPLTGGPEAARVAALSFDSDRVQTLVDAATSPHYLDTGHLLFARDGAIVAAPFDPETLELLGPAVPVLDGIAMDESSGAAQFAAAPGGHVALLRTTRPDTAATYAWVPAASGVIEDAVGSSASPASPARRASSTATGDDGAGARPERSPVGQQMQMRVLTLPFPANGLRAAALSPDAARLVVSRGDGHRTDLWLSDVTGGNVQRLTHDGHNLEPHWAPDGRRIVYAARREGPFTLFVKTIDEGAMSSTPLMESSSRHQFPTSATAEGIVYVEAHPRTGLDLWFLPWTGGPARPLVQTPFDDTSGAISPDGRWVAYLSNESGHWEAMIRARDGAAKGGSDTGTVTRIARTNGSRLAWTLDSRALLVANEGRLLQIPLTIASNGAPPTAGTPRTLATGIEASGGLDVTPDGRLLVRTRDASTASAPARLEVVLDWSRELSARVPIRPRTPRPVR